MAAKLEENQKMKSFATSKKNFGIENERINKVKKGQIIEEINDMAKYIENPCKFYIIIKGKVRVYFHKQGEVFKPFTFETSTDKANFKIDRLAPIDYEDMQSFGDFKQLVNENSFIKNIYYEALENSKIVECDEVE